MKDDKKLETILELFFNRFNAINTKTLELMGETAKKFEKLTPSEAHRLRRQLELGNDLDDLVNKISKVAKISEKDVIKVLENTAKENVEFSEVFYKAKNKEYVDYEHNEELKKFVTSIEKETNQLFQSIDKNTLGFNLVDPRTNKNIGFVNLPDTYKTILDEAIYNVASGQQDYQSAMRGILRQLADSGLRINEAKVSYGSGYQRRLDSVVRESILTSLRRTNLGIQEQIGKEFGADGFELTAHSPCAEDHLDIQGRQFTKKEFEKMNNNLMRPIGELNCKHFAFSIVMGVSQHNYTKKQLKEFRDDSLKKVKYNGKTYTKYEATQVQRQLETAIRKQKDRQIIARSSGDMQEVEKAQIKIRQYTERYKDFSNKCGLDMYMKRASVSGYKRVAIKK